MGDGSRKSKATLANERRPFTLSIVLSFHPSAFLLFHTPLESDIATIAIQGKKGRAECYLPLHATHPPCFCSGTDLFPADDRRSGGHSAAAL